MGEAKRKQTRIAGTTDDLAVQKSVFAQVFEQTRTILDDPQLDPLEALALIYDARNQGLDQSAATYGAAGKAACEPGCTSCCHQMVLCSPFEVFALARRLRESMTPDEIAAIRDRLETLSRLPLDPHVRLDRRYPCALLEAGRCTVYAERPAACRTMLSASRSACENSLASKSGTIPYLADAAKIAAVVQLAIDHAVGTRSSRSTERVELARALEIALGDCDAAMARWANGEAPFPGAEVRPADVPSNRDLARAAAGRFGVP